MEKDGEADDCVVTVICAQQVVQDKVRTIRQRKTKVLKAAVDCNGVLTNALQEVEQACWEREAYHQQM